MTNTTDPIALLKRTRSIAVVGCSARPGKDAHEIPLYLLQQGYDIAPVNPTAPEIFGRKTHRTLADVPKPLDLVAVFRPSPEAAAVTKQAIELGARAVWLPTGVANAEARQLAQEAGVEFVEDTCLRVLHQRLVSLGL